MGGQTGALPILEPHGAAVKEGGERRRVREGRVVGDNGAAWSRMEPHGAAVKEGEE